MTVSKSAICSSIAVLSCLFFISVQHNGGQNRVGVRRSLTSESSSATTTTPNRFVEGVPFGSENAPKLLWLMSYPESGDSFVIKTLQTASGMTTATNEGNVFINSANEEYVLDTYPSVPIYADRPNGPFLFSDLPVPSELIVTNTHCGGTCTDCPVDDFVIASDDFYMSCARAAIFDPANKDPAQRVRSVQYNPKLATRAVHLLRNPFDVVVARFHREYRRRAQEDDFAFTAAFPYNRDGFSAWCASVSEDLDPKRVSTRHTSGSDELEDRDYVFAEAQETVPCFSEFYKYVQWHNHAARVLANYNGNHGHLSEDGAGVFALHYEDFLHNFDGAVDSLLRFARLPRANERVERLHFERYDYFTAEEKDVAKEFMSKLMNRYSRDLLATYLSDGVQSGE